MSANKFSPATKDDIAKRAMLICSNPYCLRLTGYATTEGKARAIAEASHILPSGENGPRSEQIAGFPDLDLASAENGLWLCTGCHKKIDDDPRLYSPTLLLDWKKKHEKVVRGLVGLDLEAAILELRGSKRYHQETRDLLSFLDDRRVLYEGIDQEFPPRVLQSIELMRAKITQIRAKVDPNSKVAKALDRMQTSINKFLRSVGPRVDLNDLVCDANNPVWVGFAKALTHFRGEIVVIVAYLAEGSGYEVTHVY